MKPKEETTLSITIKAPTIEDAKNKFKIALEKTGRIGVTLTQTGYTEIMSNLRFCKAYMKNDDPNSVEALEAALAEARRQREKERARQRVEAHNEVIMLITNSDNFEWRVTPTSYTHPRSSRIYDALKVERRIKPALVSDFLRKNDVTYYFNWHGMVYYRTDEHILYHAGFGGTHVLEVPRLCRDDEWEDIRNGEIHHKFHLHPNV